MLLIAGKFLLRGNIMNRKMLVEYYEKRKERSAHGLMFEEPRKFQENAQQSAS